MTRPIRHTPGPWRISGLSDREIIAKNGTCTAMAYGPVGPWGKVKKEHAANARLIASSPNLLLACAAAYNTLRQLPNAKEHQVCIDMLKEAINTAEPNAV